MGKVTSTVQINRLRIKQLADAQIKALETTAEALHTEIVQAQVMPRDTGHMQNESTFVDYSHSRDGAVSIVTQTPYARRMYYHPEYNFQTKENPNAQGEWFEPWINGDQKNWPHDAMRKFYKMFGGV